MEDTNEKIMDELREKLLGDLQIPEEFLNVTLTEDDIIRTAKRFLLFCEVFDEGDDENERK